MVKNTTGGSGAKGYARKNFTSQKSTKLRLSEDPCEKYAQVTKMYGEMCEVRCDDNICRKCFIRGKFRGKGKRSSFIRLGEVVLVGLRSWASDTSQCDLLEVYTAQEVQQLKNHPKVPSGFITVGDLNTTSAISGEGDIFEFSNIVKEQHDEDIMPADIGRKGEIETFVLDSVDEINIDDI
jgi:initiation factor 1A